MVIISFPLSLSLSHTHTHLNFTESNMQLKRKSRLTFKTNHTHKCTIGLRKRVAICLCCVLIGIHGWWFINTKQRKAKQSKPVKFCCSKNGLVFPWLLYECMNQCVNTCVKDEKEMWSIYCLCFWSIYSSVSTSLTFYGTSIIV